MKITALLIVVASLHAGAKGFGQQITISEKNAPLKKVFQVIRKQSGYTFFIDNAWLEKARPVSIDMKNASITEVLDACMRDQPFTYQLVKETVVIRLKPTSERRAADSPSLSVVPPGHIHGKVMDERGRPVAGASVLIRGTDKGVSTNEAGEFSLETDEEKVTLVISSIGYEKKQIAVTSAVPVSVSLSPLHDPMQEYVITGFQIPTQKKKVDIPITTITGEQLTRSAFNGVQDIFRGLVPDAVYLDRGASIFTNSIALRGGSSTSGLNSVKMYIDGIAVTSSTYDLSMLDLNSIDRVEVSRGPAGSTLYGSNASGGIIQIFTKKGNGISGQNLNVNASAGTIHTKWADDKDVLQQRYNLDYMQNQGNTSFNVGGSYEYKGPWVPSYKDKKINIYGGIRTGGKALTNDLTVRYSKDNYNAPDNVILKQAAIPGASNPTNVAYGFTTMTAGDNLAYKPFSWWTHQLTVGVDMVDYELNSTKPSASNTYTNYSYIAQTANLRYTTTIRYPDTKYFKSNIVLGAEAVQDRVSSYTGSTSGIYGSFSTTGTFQKEKVNSKGYFAQWQPEIIDRIFLTAGIRAEKNDLFGNDYGTAYSPRFGGTTNFRLGTVTVKPRVSYGVSIQAPLRTYKEGSISGTTIYMPNPNIGPQKQSGADAGLNFFLLHNKLDIGLTYFSQHIEGQIDRILVSQTGTSTTYQYQNVGRVNNNGLETELNYTANNLKVTVNYSVLFNNKVKRLSPNYSGYLKVGDNLIGVPLTTAGGSISYTFSKLGKTGGLAVTADGTYYGNMTNLDYINYYKGLYGLAPSLGNQRAYWMKYDKIAKFNLSLQYSVSRPIKVFTQIRNITNSYTSEINNSVEMPGRSFLAGIKASLLK